MYDCEDIEIDCEYLSHTPDGIKISDGDKELWLPRKFVVSEDSIEDLNEGDSIVIHIPEWLAKKEGLI